MKVLVIGGGGREHAIVDALSRSPQVEKIFCAPGNAGITAQAECVAIRETEVERLRDFAAQNGIGLTVVIREGALADAVFLDLENERLVPNFNLTSNWVYSADTRAVRSVLCDGKFVMKDGMVEDAQETIARARQSVKAILSR